MNDCRSDVSPVNNSDSDSGPVASKEMFEIVDDNGQRTMDVCEPGHEKKCLMSYANNKGADQPVHPRSLISAFFVRCLDNGMSLVSVTKISSLMLASVAEQASLSLTWSEIPEDTFSHAYTISSPL